MIICPCFGGPEAPINVLYFRIIIKTLSFYSKCSGLRNKLHDLPITKRHLFTDTSPVIKRLLYISSVCAILRFKCLTTIFFNLASTFIQPHFSCCLIDSLFALSSVSSLSSLDIGCLPVHHLVCFSSKEKDLFPMRKGHRERER